MNWYMFTDHMRKLPKPLKHYIFQFLSKNDLKNLRKTCVYMHRTTESYKLRITWCTKNNLVYNPLGENKTTGTNLPEVI